MKNKHSLKYCIWLVFQFFIQKYYTWRNKPAVSSMVNWGAWAKTKNEKLEISSFKKYRVLKKVICKYF